MADRTPNRERERGATMALVGISLVTLLAFTALAVDIGLGSSRTRDLQQVADLVALDVSRLLTGGTPPANTEIDAQVADSAARNDFPIAGTFPDYVSGTRTIHVELGCWQDADGFAGPALGTYVAGCPGPNAARVTAEDDVDYAFADVIGFGGDRFDRTATAALIPRAHVAIGSVGAGVQNGLNDPITARVNAQVQALNGRLKAAFGTDASLTPPPNGAGLDVLGWQGLAASSVTLGNLAAAAGLASPHDLTTTSMTAGQLVNATATALRAEGNEAAATNLETFFSSFDFDSASTIFLGGDDGPLQLEQGTGTEDDPGAARARMNVVDLLTAAASVIDGRNFVSWSIGGDALAALIPGVRSVAVTSHVIEVPQHGFGPVGTSVHSAQVRLELSLELDSSDLGIPGTDLPLTLPLVIEGASGDATLARIQCLEPLPLSETDVLAETSLGGARAWVGAAPNMQNEGGASLTIQNEVVLEAGPLTLEQVLYFGLNPLLGLLLGSDVTGGADASLGGGTSTHTFLPAAEPPPTPAQRAMGGLSADIGTQLAGDLTIIGLPLLGVTNLQTALTTVFNDVGAGIIDPILRAAGVTLGGADVWSDDIICDAPLLVG